MGRFQWIQGHPKQGSDRLHAVAHDWFSKDGAEPSRQALVETMKEHASGTGDMSSGRHARSRTNTTTSTVSSFTRSLSNGSNEVTSRPSSGHGSTDINLPPPERHEGHAKGLISRGTRILKRQGSKLSLMPSQLEEPSSGRVVENSSGGSPIRAIRSPVNMSSKRECSRRPILLLLTNVRSWTETKHIWTIRIPTFVPRRPSQFPEREGHKVRADFSASFHPGSCRQAFNRESPLCDPAVNPHRSR